jgi:sugar fermentation stimulation protein A
MRFQTPLVPGRLVRRYKRFFADVELEANGELVTAHCPNTGPMTGLVEPGGRVWLEPNNDPKKKLKFGWRLLEQSTGHFTGVDTSLPNRIVREALLANAFPSLAAYDTVLPEQKYGTNSRVDFLLKAEKHADAYVEVKSVTLSRKTGLAEFPDTVTDRGRKHLQDLETVASEGKRAVMLYLVQRTDCDRVTLAQDIDPAYVSAFVSARTAGMETIAVGCRISPQEIEVSGELDFRLDH